MKYTRMSKFVKVLWLLICILQYTLKTNAQAVGSVETASPASINIVAGGTYSSAAESLYIGPGTYTIDGTWEIYSKNLYISKDAVLNGTGTLKLFNPLDAGGASGPTFIDGNGSTNAITPTIEIDNPNNVEQADQPLSTAFTVAGWTDVIGNAGVYAAGIISFNARNGDWITNANKLTLSSTASLTGYYNCVDDATDATHPRGYVVTNDNSGELIREGIGNGNSFFFPIGRAEGGEAEYSPANITVNSGGPATYHMNVRSFDESTPPNDEDIFPLIENMQRTWMIYANNPGSVAFMEFIHNSVLSDNGYDPENISTFVYDGAGNWNATHVGSTEVFGLYGTTINYGTQYANRSVPVYTSSGVEMYYTKSVGPLTLLPLTLVGFEATKNGNAALLTWKTEQEHAISQFVVERGDGFGKWATVGTVTAQGGGGYNLTDGSVLNGANYYRLKIIATDGKATYSALRLLNFGQNLTIAAYPNPVHSLLTIAGLGTDTKGWLEVYDLSGKALIKKPTTGSNTMQLKMDALAAGWYLLKVTDKNGSVSLARLMKQ